MLKNVPEEHAIGHACGQQCTDTSIPSIEKRNGGAGQHRE